MRMLADFEKDVKPLPFVKGSGGGGSTGGGPAGGDGNAAGLAEGLVANGDEEQAALMRGMHLVSGPREAGKSWEDDMAFTAMCNLCVCLTEL